MWLRDPLDDILSSPAKVRVLRTLCQVNAPLCGREIARRSRVWPSAAAKALGELSASGLVLCADHGRANTYEMGCNQVGLVRSLRELFAAEADRYRAVARGLGEADLAVRSVFLFGSEARGDAKPASDADVLLVVGRLTRSTQDRLLARCLSIAEEGGLALAWHTADIAQLRKWEQAGDPFWMNVKRDAIRLYGQPWEVLVRPPQPGRTS